VPAGVDPVTGEVLEEAVEAPVSAQEVSEVPETALEPQNVVQAAVEAPVETVLEDVDLETEVTFDDIEWDTEPVEKELQNIIEEEGARDMTDKEFADWFDAASEIEKDVAAYGHVYKKFDSLAKVVLVAQESTKDAYDWCANSAQRYTYAAENISYDGPAREKKELVKASSNDFMDADW
jgi:hypothetical protein